MNHPGTTCEDSSLRPGYWHGNGVFPALKQEGALLAGIYHIPQNYPVHFVHAYLPSERFDEVLSDGPWIYCRKNTGYFAFWCPIARTPYNDRLFHCEIRYIAETVPFVVVAGDEKEYGGISTVPRFTPIPRACICFLVDIHEGKAILEVSNFYRCDPDNQIGV